MAVGTPVLLGTSIPSRSHSISVHLPTWKDVVGVGSGDLKSLGALKSGYPRSNLHPDVRKLIQVCIEKISPCFPHEVGLLLFPDLSNAKACQSYILDAKDALMASDHLQIFRVTFDRSTPTGHDSQHQNAAPLWAVVFPDSVRATAAFFWRLTGLGISSRRAAAYLDRTSCIQFSEVSGRSKLSGNCNNAPVYEQLREGVAQMLTRAAINPDCANRVSPSDVFLHPSGMSTIYNVHHMLLQWRNAGSVMMGFPYELTLKILETYGPSCVVYSSNSSNDIAALERYLSAMASERTAKKSLQAIWCECPSNPLLWTPDLQRVRELADQYDLAVVVDDTIGSSANVDVLNVADIVVTSLTKSFSGFANVLAGSATLNPKSRYYSEFKTLLAASYVNNLYIEDAIQLEINSRTYLERVATTNDTAEFLVDHLRPLVHSSTNNHSVALGAVRQADHLIRAVYFPKESPSMDNFVQQMRRPNDDFKPGYGCLFTIEFETVHGAARFFDNLDLCKGPSLGADVTLALPYVQMVLQQEKEWAAGHGLRETIVRISVGLEDKHDLLRRIKLALANAGGVVMSEEKS